MVLLKLSDLGCAKVRSRGEAGGNEQRLLQTRLAQYPDQIPAIELSLLDASRSTDVRTFREFGNAVTFGAGIAINLEVGALVRDGAGRAFGGTIAASGAFIRVDFHCHDDSP